MDYLNCDICELRCRISEGKTGRCGRYVLINNMVQEKFPDQYLVACPISIETMPMLHFRPKGKFLQITTTGCNFNCPGCISTVLVREMSPESKALINLAPDQIVSKAIEAGCEGIAFLMNDPIAAFPGFLKTAEIAHKEELKVGCSSNAYFTSESLNRLIPFLDFINIGMKGFTDDAYMACGAPWLSPVLRNMNMLYNGGVHIEVSCILTKKNHQEIMELAAYISGISKEIPFQIMRFLPFEAADISLEPSVREAEAFCERVRKVLNYVYLFNTPGSAYLHTICPQCSHPVIHRDFYGPMGAKVKPPVNQQPDDVCTCPSCSHHLNIVGPSSFTSFKEGDFEGGYPLTRAMEIVEAMLIAMGVTSKATVISAWEEMLQGDGLKRLHINIQNPHKYIETLRHFGQKAGVQKQAERLAGYLEDRLIRVERTVNTILLRPRTYYAMTKPLFYINIGRLENQLVETAGGHSINREIPQGGRPGATITVQELNRLDPEVIFISAFISNSVEDFHSECLEQGIEAMAVRNKRIYKHPAPGWDFGTPRWILGLMFITSVLHPDKCQFDVMEEARVFYEDFYGLPFDTKDINLSFSKPDSNWRWQD